MSFELKDEWTYLQRLINILIKYETVPTPLIVYSQILMLPERFLADSLFHMMRGVDISGFPIRIFPRIIISTFFVKSSYFKLQIQ